MTHHIELSHKMECGEISSWTAFVKYNLNALICSNKKPDSEIKQPFFLYFPCELAKPFFFPVEKSQYPNTDVKNSSI